MNPTRLSKILADHALWIEGKKGRRVNLTNADLSNCDLTGANLRASKLPRAILRNAILTGANLSGADLTKSDLTGADLSRCDLTDARLTNAIMVKSNLTDAILVHADMTDCKLTGAQLLRADLTNAVMANADLNGAILTGYNVPAIAHLDARIYARITSGGGTLSIDDWHTCATTHCRAGWAITIAGEAGAKLEREVGPAAAGALIYAVSRPGRLPNFLASHRYAMASIKADAEADPLPAE